ncbi:MAG TPA: RNA-binding cell elongation regulator Jag/EloR [Chloroflexota bacterium]
MVEDGVEFSARTVDEAIARAETHFGTGRNDLAIEIITQGSRGVFGIGAENARIRARIPGASAPEPAQVETSPPTPAETPADDVTFDAAHDAQPAISEAERSDTVRVERADSDNGSTKDGANLPEEARDVLDAILSSMGFDADVSVRSEENPVILAVSGQNLGVLIGRRGDNLASLQFMVNLILSKNRRQWPRVVIDVENYRARREESLRSLADRIAYRVGRNGRPFTLEAMPASDRRVIHLALREREGVETYSIGEGVSRRVVIAPVRPPRDAEDERY